MSSRGVIPGVELLFAIIQKDVKSRHDLVVACLHWFLVKNGFHCISLGENVTTDTDFQPSELLPAGWNDDQDVYSLQYINTDVNEKHVLKIVKMDEGLLLNFMRVRDEKVADSSVEVEQFTSGDWSSFDRAYHNLEELVAIFTKELLQPLRCSSSTGQMPSERQSASSRNRKMRSPPRNAPALRTPVGMNHPPPPDWLPSSDPFAVGRGDLDPLGSGVGGMFMDPLHQGGRRWPFGSGGGLPPPGSEFVPGGLPRGAVPPGARFDPFGPPMPEVGRGPRHGPDPDHMPPPGFDDMFM